MTKKTFEDRFEETAKKASAVMERPPDEMKPLARKTATEFVQELENLYEMLVITDQDTEGLVLEPRQVELAEKHQNALIRISDLLYSTYIKMGKEDDANDWKKRAETLTKVSSNDKK